MLDTGLQIIIDTLQHEMKGLYDGFFMQQKRIDLLERVFGKLMQLDMRLDTLEFNSEVSVKPAIGEKLMDIDCRLQNLELILLKKEREDER